MESFAKAGVQMCYQISRGLVNLKSAIPDFYENNIPVVAAYDLDPGAHNGTTGIAGGCMRVWRNIGRCNGRLHGPDVRQESDPDRAW